MLIKQIEKKIDVLKANYFTDDEIFSMETCLIKISTPLSIDNPEVSDVVRRFRANVIEMNSTYCIVERKGRSSSINGLYESLNALGVVLQFVRSGRIAVTRSHIEHLDQYLSERASEANSEE